jgi:hypothetical protein
MRVLVPLAVIVLLTAAATAVSAPPVPGETTQDEDDIEAPPVPGDGGVDNASEAGPPPLPPDEDDAMNDSLEGPPVPGENDTGQDPDSENATDEEAAGDDQSGQGPGIIEGIVELLGSIFGAL